MSSPSRLTLYITLSWLRLNNGKNQYHWALYASGERPPEGTLYHATDRGRKALDLRYEPRPVSNPMRSAAMVVCLKIADAPSQSAIEAVVRQVQVMKPNYLPAGEPRWTCRVWVKQALTYLHQNRVIRLPADVDTIERWCWYQADSNVAGRIQRGQGIKVSNDLGWMSRSISRTPTPMQIDSIGSQQQYYGSKPMVVDSTGQQPYYGSKPMVTDTTRSRTQQPYPYRTKPMVTDPARSYGTGSYQSYQYNPRYR